MSIIVAILFDTTTFEPVQTLQIGAILNFTRAKFHTTFVKREIRRARRELSKNEINRVLRCIVSF